jgi:hypothetical protein
VHLGIPMRIRKAHEGGDRLALQVQRSADAAGLACPAKRPCADQALGVHGTEPGMRTGQRAHGRDELRNHGAWCDGVCHGEPPRVMHGPRRRSRRAGGCRSRTLAHDPGPPGPSPHRTVPVPVGVPPGSLQRLERSVRGAIIAWRDTQKIPLRWADHVLWRLPSIARILVVCSGSRAPCDRMSRTCSAAYTYCISRRNFFGGRQLRLL